MSNKLYTAKSFLLEAKKVFTIPGASAVQKGILWVGLAVVTLMGIGAADHYSFTLTGKAMSFAIAGVLFLVWASIAIGYGIAKMFRAKIIVDEELVMSRDNHSIRLPVKIQGFGKANITGSVEEIRVNGERLFGSDGIPIEWTFHPDKTAMELQEDAPHTSLSVFSFLERIPHIHGVYHEQPIYNHGYADIWVKVGLRAEGCDKVFKWVGIRYIQRQGYSKDIYATSLPNTIDNWSPISGSEVCPYA